MDSRTLERLSPDRQLVCIRFSSHLMKQCIEQYEVQGIEKSLIEKTLRLLSPLSGEVHA